MTTLRWWFRQILWPSQNIYNLPDFWILHRQTQWLTLHRVVNRFVDKFKFLWFFTFPNFDCSDCCFMFLNFWRKNLTGSTDARTENVGIILPRLTWLLTQQKESKGCVITWIHVPLNWDVCFQNLKEKLMKKLKLKEKLKLDWSSWSCG